MIERLVLFLCIAVPVALLGGLGYAIYEDATSPTFALRKDQWGCTASHQETYMTYVSYDGGKTQTPVWNTDTVCDQWSRR